MRGANASNSPTLWPRCHRPDREHILPKVPTTPTAPRFTTNLQSSIAAACPVCIDDLVVSGQIFAKAFIVMCHHRNNAPEGWPIFVRQKAKKEDIRSRYV